MSTGMSLGYIGMVHHDHEGVWPEEHEPYMVYMLRSHAERAAQELAAASPHGPSPQVVEVMIETFPRETP